jgi:FkbH-like protein
MDADLQLQVDLLTATSLLRQGELAAAARALAGAAGQAANGDAGATSEARRQVARGLVALADAYAARARRGTDQGETALAADASLSAERSLELAAALAPTEAIPSLAAHLEAAGRADEAIEQWRHLLGIQPSHDAASYLRLARLYEQTDRPEDALATYLHLLDALPATRNTMLVGQKLDALAASLPEPTRAQRIKIALLGNASMEQLQAYLSVECYRNGLRPTFYEVGFDQYTQALLDPSSRLYALEPDVTVCAIHASRLFPGLHHDPLTLTVDERRREIEGGLQTVQRLLDAFSERSTGLLLLHTMVLPQQPALGILDWHDELGQAAAFGEVNQRLAALIRERYPNVYLLDEDRVQARVGKAHTTDPRLWLAARMPWSDDLLAELAREYLRYIRPLKGLARKVIALDLDDTLWGGIIGEDGLGGIQLGSDAPGNAYVAFQRELEKLWRRGILLAICSKNNEADAWAVFDQHPDMVLKRSHFAAARINWSPKSENLKSLADELGLGLQSFVFLDDNPRECEQVRMALPEVLTVSLPRDPARYRETLLNLGVFDSLGLTQEDLDRNRQYAERRARRDFESALPTGDGLGEYLAELEIVAEVAPADALTIPRIAQLTNKTNQFNLTTRRYSEAQVAAMPSQGWRVYGLRVRDRFGDEGLVGVAIVAPGPVSVDDGAGERGWELDTLLLSCRVIGRGIETALLAFLAEEVRRAGGARLEGWFIPTGKNELVRDLFQRHGFRMAEERPDGSRRWELDLAGSALAVPEWVTLRVREAAAP